MAESTINTRSVKWVLLADGCRGRLLRCSLTEDGRCRVQEEGYIETGEDSGNESDRKFASKLAEWLAAAADRLGIVHLMALGPPAFLRLFKEQCPKALSGRITNQRGHMLHCSLRALAEHPKIIALVHFESNEARSLR